jgi:DNA-binding PadR family transcriptional regulator
MSREKLTTPDLVLLSLLAERPMHGYEANALLEKRKVRDWAAVSRPQVYYSLEKLAGLGLIKSMAEESEKPGPERHTYATTGEGKASLADALEREDWAEQLERPPFLTWLALSWQARPGVFLKQLRRRQEFLRAGIARKEGILQAVLKEVGHPFHEAVWMLSLAIEQLRTELAWTEQVVREFPHRERARNPRYEPK